MGKLPHIEFFFKFSDFTIIFVRVYYSPENAVISSTVLVITVPGKDGLWWHGLHLVQDYSAKMLRDDVESPKPTVFTISDYDIYTSVFAYMVRLCHT
jgi:hypothetical protein